MGSDHNHNAVQGTNERPLWMALGLTTAFLIAEVIGGVLTNSLALISDAAHMLTDAAALAVSLIAIRIGKRPADNQRTFGYYRFEILAATFNAVLLFLVALYILYEAYRRISNPPQIASMAMLIVAVIGLVVNWVSMRLLSAGKDASLNIKGAYLEVWSDMLGSLGVIAAAIIIRVTQLAWVDSVIAVLIGLWVLPRTWILLKASMNVLLEGVPDGMNTDDLAKAILAVTGVQGMHELHVWSISSGKTSLTTHIVADAVGADQEAMLMRIRAMLAERFDIHHSTVQIERVPCPDAESHTYGPRADAQHKGAANDPAG